MNPALTWRSRAAIIALQVALVGTGVLLWQVLSGPVLDPSLVSSPSAIWRQTLRWLQRGALQQATFDTLRLVALGVATGAVSGFAVGLLSVFADFLGDLLEPLVSIFFALPKVALIPLFILWFGTGDEEKIAVAATVVFCFFFFAARSGAAALPAGVDNMLLITGATRLQRLRLLYLPASTAWLLAGLRVGLPYGFVAIVGAEIIASQAGLGHLAQSSASVMNAAGTFSAVCVLTLLSASISGLVTWLVSRTRWNHAG